MPKNSDKKRNTLNDTFEETLLYIVKEYNKKKKASIKLPSFETMSEKQREHTLIRNLASIGSYTEIISVIGRIEIEFTQFIEIQKAIDERSIKINEFRKFIAELESKDKKVTYLNSLKEEAVSILESYLAGGKLNIEKELRGLKSRLSSLQQKSEQSAAAASQTTSQNSSSSYSCILQSFIASYPNATKEAQAALTLVTNLATTTPPKTTTTRPSSTTSASSAVRGIFPIKPLSTNDCPSILKEVRQSQEGKETASKQNTSGIRCGRVGGYL